MPPPAASAGTRAATLLVVTVTKGFRHESIPTAERVLQGLADRSGTFLVDFARTEADLTAKMTPTALGAYRGVAFVSTTGDLPLPDRERFLAWVARGHGFVGVPATADTFHGYPRYLDMLGGEFRRHGPETTVALRVKDPDHPVTRGIRRG